MIFTTLLISSILSLASAQQVGVSFLEKHPALAWDSCTKSSGCQTQSQGGVVLDANWRWAHDAIGTKMRIDGADYTSDFGITTSGTTLLIKHTDRTLKSGARVYLMANDSSYQTFKLKNRELAFEVDTSKLSCGLNSALYFVQMDPDGGMAKYPTNKAGAKYGTGYCDAKFLETFTSLTANEGTGRYGACCNEVDVWNANSFSTAYIANPCPVQELTRCSDSECASYCDQDGCDFNPYRLGNLTYYGNGMTIDTKQSITVVTQFITADNTTTGALREIRRLYIKNGKVVQNPKAPFPDYPAMILSPKSIVQLKRPYSTTPIRLLPRGASEHLMMRWTRAGVSYKYRGEKRRPKPMARWQLSTRLFNIPAWRFSGCLSISMGKHTTPSELLPTASVKFSNLRFGDIGTTYSV
ncbi:glycosyl hydrolase 7 (cellulase C) family [Rhizoctonia solani]|uniref:Glucanase n=1 Tax=Rhizoctonia solani TaxID=456999 RepID=A0A8H7M9N5_9AGAM|nr:glycosyl hydrolase 7 (cellulase C) family [Rhizoctonia solani]